jgi:hypothetical protein
MGTTAPLAPPSLTAMRSVLPQYGVFRPTAAAKLLYFLRPNAVTASDKAISARTGGGSDQQAFLRHLTLCRTRAVALEQEASRRGIGPEEIGRALGRPASSVAKLIDEWLWAAISGSFSGDGSR